MTSTDAPDDDTTEATGDTSTASADVSADGSAGDDGKHGEAQRYRTRLRSAEAERDAAQTRLAVMEQRHVERLAAVRLADGSDLTTFGGITIDNLRDDDGELDDQLIDAALDELLTQRPGLARPRPAASFDGGQRSGSTPRPADWQKMIRGR